MLPMVRGCEKLLTQEHFDFFDYMCTPVVQVLVHIKLLFALPPAASPAPCLFLFSLLALGLRIVAPLENFRVSTLFSK